MSKESDGSQLDLKTKLFRDPFSFNANCVM